ncbi:hypothetical protein GCM10028824_06730 [Hymenobacter segetis]
MLGVADGRLKGAAVPHIDKIGQREIKQVHPLLLGTRGQRVGGAVGQLFAVAQAAGAAQQEKEVPF